MTSYRESLGGEMRKERVVLTGREANPCPVKSPYLLSTGSTIAAPCMRNRYPPFEISSLAL